MFMLFVKDFLVKMAILIFRKGIESYIYVLLGGMKSIIISAVAFEKYVGNSSQN